MTPKLFHDAGEALYGPRWQSDIARDLNMSDRHVRRLASGAAELSPGMAADLQRICEERMALLADVIRRLSAAAE
jgi:methylphosphotriester-DNA--protein-cysteine methyltransferase